MNTLLRELRYGLRTLIKARGFSLIAALTLALGIGASTAIFSVVDAVLLRALPFPDPDRIVRIWEQKPNGRRINLADPNFDDFRDQNHTFASMAIYNEMRSPISGASEPVRAFVPQVSRGFFQTLGGEPFRGRSFAPDEQRLHGTPAMIVSYRFWQQYLGGASDLSRFHLTMSSGLYSVVGVMPPDFDFPAGADAWTPRELDPETPARSAHNWRAIGRIKPDATLTQARADLGAIARRIRAQYGKDVDLSDAAMVPLADALVGNVRSALLTLLASVGLLLLVACANVAGLLVARTSTRRKELAVRVALGAGRGRLTRQFLAESFWLSLAGGILGILLAAWAVRVLPAIIPAQLPRHEGIAINTTVLLFALAAIAAVAVSLGLFAAWRAGSGDLQEALASGSRGFTSGGASHRLRGLLVVAEIAVTLVILIGAGLLGRSFLQLINTNAGFNQENLITIEFLPRTLQFNDTADEQNIKRVVRPIEEVVARLRAIPGAGSVSMAGAVPVAAGDNLADGTFLILNGRKPPVNGEEWKRFARDPSVTGHALYAAADSGYFRTIGIPMRRGRAFSEFDDVNSTHVAVISDSLAQQYWPGKDPTGQTIFFGNMDGNPKPLTIVGVAGDVRAQGLDLPASPVIYVDYRQRGLNINADPVILMRTTAPVAQIAPSARAVFHELIPDVPVKFSTFAEELGGWLADRRFLLLLVGLFATAAMILAAVGIYGVVSFSVARRTQEIGIRMALGARRDDVLRLIVGEGARLALFGVAIGIAASFAVTRLLSSLLFGISATDPVTFIAVAALLSLVALLASYIPARRAIRLDPNIALRYE